MQFRPLTSAATPVGSAEGSSLDGATLNRYQLFPDFPSPIFPSTSPCSIPTMSGSCSPTFKAHPEWPKRRRVSQADNECGTTPAPGHRSAEQWRGWGWEGQEEVDNRRRLACARNRAGLSPLLISLFSQQHLQAPVTLYHLQMRTLEFREVR